MLTFWTTGRNVSVSTGSHLKRFAVCCNYRCSLVRSSIYAHYYSTNIRVNISHSSVVAFRILGSRSTQACNNIIYVSEQSLIKAVNIMRTSCQQLCTCQQSCTAVLTLYEDRPCSIPTAVYLLTLELISCVAYPVYAALVATLTSKAAGAMLRMFTVAVPR
jgi:hypothetical protein